MQAQPILPLPSTMHTNPILRKHSTAPPPYSSIERRDLDGLVKRCEASLAQLSTLTNKAKSPKVKHTTIKMSDDKKAEAVTVTITEVKSTKTKNIKSQKQDGNSRKYKVSKKNTRPPLSRTSSATTTSTASESVQEGIVLEDPGLVSPPYFPSPNVQGPTGDYFSQKQTVSTDVTPTDANICTLLQTGIATCSVPLTEICLSYLRKRAIFHPLIAIKACSPYAVPHPSFPSSVIPYVRPILQEAVRTLLDDFPEYDSGEACTKWSAYLDSVPPALQQLFSHEWCRYVRRIKSFHENSPWDDFDYDHTSECIGGRVACEQHTRIKVRDAWNAFWRESILSGNRCVPRPSQVAKFFCTYGDEDDEIERTMAPNARCRAGLKEELIQTLECIGGVNAKWNWRFLGDRMDVFGK